MSVSDKKALKILTDLVDYIHQQHKDNPSREALIQLLRICDPSLTAAAADGEEEPPPLTDKKLKSTFNKLSLLFHPDKFQKGVGGSQAVWTSRFQDLGTFFKNCLAAPAGEEEPPKKKTRRSTSVVSPGQIPKSRFFPQDFHLSTSVAPSLTSDMSDPIVPMRTAKAKQDLSLEKCQLAIGLKTIHVYGGIALGRPIEAPFTEDDQSWQLEIVENGGIKGLFGEYGEHKTFESVEDIQKHLTEKGPVVSTSFELTEQFYSILEQEGAHAHSFSDALIGERHPVIIVGWGLASNGAPVWLVRSIRGSEDIPIAMGCLSIEDEVIAPTHDFSDIAWQNEDNTVDVEFPEGFDLRKADGPNIEVQMPPDEMQTMFEILNCSFKEFTPEDKFLLRDSKHLVRDRVVYLEDCRWDSEAKAWKVVCGFTD